MHKHTYGSNRPHSLTHTKKVAKQPCEFAAADGGCQHALSELFQMKGT